MISRICTFLVIFLVALPALSFGQSAEDAGEDVARVEERLGLSLSLELSSIYNFRGLNLFRESSQHDQHFVLMPSITYQLSDVGVWFNYRAAYQVTGDNRSEIVDIGYGDEQDLGVGYWRDFFNDRLTFNASFYYYFYPFADESIAGAKWPSYLEPSVGLTYHTFADVSLNALYYLGVQSSVEDFSYLYINPRISKRVDVTEKFDILAGAGLGCKVYKDYSNKKDNIFDVVVDVEGQIKLLKHFYIAPSLHYGWTNFRGVSFVNESMLYGGLKLGSDI